MQLEARGTNMKHHIGLTIDQDLLKQIEKVRGREKRSTFMEHLLRLGFKAYLDKKEQEEPKPCIK